MNGQDRDRQHLLPKASPFGTRGLAHKKGRLPTWAAGPQATDQTSYPPCGAPEQLLLRNSNSQESVVNHGSPIEGVRTVQGA